MKVLADIELPTPFRRALEKEHSRERCDITVTQLIAPPQAVELQERHGHRAIVPLSKLMPSFIGIAVHDFLSRQEDDAGAQHEVTLTSDELGWSWKGQLDRYCDGLITDYKCVKPRAIRDGKPKDDWVYQLNLYAELCRRNGLDVRELEISTIYGSAWDFGEARRDSRYPQQAAERIAVPLWHPNDINKYLRDRIIVHQSARGVDEEDLPPCSDEERWIQRAGFALRKEGRATAVKIYPTRGEALAALQAAKDPRAHYIEERKGLPMRCASYCDASAFCKQWEKDKNNKDDEW